MSETMHPAAPHHLPGFITAPGETDVLMTAMIVLLVVLVMVMGSLYFWLHSVPERIAHGTSKLQFQLVAVLALLALFTHNNAFWVAALLLALVPIPDFWTPLATMAEALTRMAGRRLRGATADEPTISVVDATAAPETPLLYDPAAISPGLPDTVGGTLPTAETAPPQTDEIAPVPHVAAAPSAKVGGKRRQAMSMGGHES